MTARQKYHVVKDFDDFELRVYDPCVIAEVSINDDLDGATSKAFGTLFRYISGNNGKSEKIAMTSPVISSTLSSVDSREWNISFVMPVGAVMADLPLPKNAEVALRSVNEERCLAISFRGNASAKACNYKESQLRTFAKDQGYDLTSETRICRFDPPFKPAFLRYNEIVIPIAG